MTTDKKKTKSFGAMSVWQIIFTLILFLETIAVCAKFKATQMELIVSVIVFYIIMMSVVRPPSPLQWPTTLLGTRYYGGKPRPWLKIGDSTEPPLKNLTYAIVIIVALIIIFV